MSLISALVFAACVSSAFAMDMDKFNLSGMFDSRNLLIVIGIFIIGIAGYMLMSCPCCSNGKCSDSGMKKMKRHTDRTASVDSKRNSSTSSIRKSPRKSKLN